MTRKELYDWIASHGCKQEPLKESTTGRSIKIVNPPLKRNVYLVMPIDARMIKAMSVFSYL